MRGKGSHSSCVVVDMTSVSVEIHVTRMLEEMKSKWGTRRPRHCLEIFPGPAPKTWHVNKSRELEQPSGDYNHCRTDQAGARREVFVKVGTTWRHSHCHDTSLKQRWRWELPWLAPSSCSPISYQYLPLVEPEISYQKSLGTLQSQHQLCEMEKYKRAEWIWEQPGKWSPYPLKSEFKQNEKQCTSQIGWLVDCAVQVWCTAGPTVIFHRSYSQLLTITEFPGAQNGATRSDLKRSGRYNVFRESRARDSATQIHLLLSCSLNHVRLCV